MSRLNTKSRIELAHLKRQLELRGKQPWKSSNLRKEPTVFPSSGTKGTLTASGNLLSTPNTTTSTYTKTATPAVPPNSTFTPTANNNNSNKNANSNTAAASARRSGAEENVPSPGSRPLDLPSSTTNSNNNETSQASKFDYKFVFTNTAMRKEDRIFRVKNPGVAIEKDMKIVKPLMATTSFLPYGVTIRNPHMFEEDQLAVIQRRQQVHNITYPTPQYNPFMTVRRERASKTKLVSTSTSKSDRREGTGTGIGTSAPSSFSSSPVPISAIVSTSPSQNNTGQNTGAVGSSTQAQASSATPIIPNRYSSGHAKANRRVRLANALHNRNTSGKLNSTALRDNQFRQQFQNLEKSTTQTDVVKNFKGENFLRNRHKQAVDNLSNTVQHLNRYEERLKQYLKSKNTMSHASHALKQLWSLRSKKISQLSKLTVTLPPETSTSPSSWGYNNNNNNNNTRQLLRSQPAFQNLSTSDAPEQKTNNNNNKNANSNKLENNNEKNTQKQNQEQIETNRTEQSSSSDFPKHPQNYLADRKFIKSPLDSQRLSKVIGKKNWSGDKNNPSFSRRWTKHNPNHINNSFNINSTNSSIMNGGTDFKITPLQAAMMEGVDLDQISDLIGSPKPNPNHNTSQQIGPMPVKANNNYNTNNILSPSPSNSPSPLNILNEKNTNDNNSTSFLADKIKPTVSLYRYNDRDRDVRLLRPTNKQRYSSNLPLFNDTSNLVPFNLGSERSSQHHLGYGVNASGMESRRESQIFRRLYNEYHLHEDKIQNELKKEEWSGRKSREKKQSDQSSKRIKELNKQLNYRKVVKL